MESRAQESLSLGDMKMTSRFDMTFHNLTTIELISQANDAKALSTMDQGDLKAMIKELSDRLEQHFYMSMAEVHNRKYE